MWLSIVYNASIAATRCLCISTLEALTSGSSNGSHIACDAPVSRLELLNAVRALDNVNFNLRPVRVLTLIFSWGSRSTLCFVLGCREGPDLSFLVGSLGEGPLLRQYFGCLGTPIICPGAGVV